MHVHETACLAVRVVSYFLILLGPLEVNNLSLLMLHSAYHVLKRNGADYNIVQHLELTVGFRSFIALS